MHVLISFWAGHRGLIILKSQGTERNEQEEGDRCVGRHFNFSYPRPFLLSRFTSPNSFSVQSLSEQLSYLHLPRPFKNPAYARHVKRRAKNLKAVLSAERERERQERQDREKARWEKMDVDVAEAEGNGESKANMEEEDLPTCTSEEAVLCEYIERLWVTFQTLPSRPLRLYGPKNTIAISLV
jgi:hypothetical protein